MISTDLVTSLDAEWLLVLRKFGLANVLSLSVDELVVKDGSRELVLGPFLLLVLHPDEPALAKDFAVLLAGDFFGHFKNHFYQRVFRKTLGAFHQDAGLAQIHDRTFGPGAEVLHAVADRGFQLDSTGAGNPSRLANVLAALGSGRVRGVRFDALGPAHGRPVVLVLGGAEQANLIKLPICSPTWPGKLMGATTEQENIQYLLWHGSFRLPAKDAGAIMMHRNVAGG